MSNWAVPYPLTSGSNHSGGKVQLVIKRSLFPSIPSQDEWNEPRMRFCPKQTFFPECQMIVAHGISSASTYLLSSRIGYTASKWARDRPPIVKSNCGGKTIEFFAVTCVRVCVVIHSYSLIGFGYPRIKKFLFVLQSSSVCAESYLLDKPFGLSFTQTCMIYFKNSNISFPIQLHICKISRYCMSQICNGVGMFRDRIGGNTEL